MPKMSKAQAKKRMKEISQKALRVLFDCDGAMNQKDMVEIDKVVDRVLNRLK